MATTQIKRLLLNNKEFVPITLAEAVVVNTDNLLLMNGQGITTLDKVLSIALSTVGGAITDIDALETAVNTINLLLANKQDKLTAGSGITIKDGVISSTMSAELYKIVEQLPTPDKDHLNTIYLVPYNSETLGNVVKEFICIESENRYYWEELGSVLTDVSLEGYVLKTEYQAKIAELETSISNINTTLSNTITATNVKVNGQNVVVNYTFTDSDIYGSMLSINDGDYVQS